MAIDCCRFGEEGRGEALPDLCCVEGKEKFDC